MMRVVVCLQIYKILNRRKNYCFQLFKIHRVSDIRQIEMHIAELLVPHPSPFEIEIAIVKLKRYKSPGGDRIPAEVMKQEVKHYDWR
jgi:hypothetical protein